MLYRGFAGRPPELKWLLTSPIFSGFSRFSRHFEGQRYRTFYGKNHRHYCDLNANQVCYTFLYVLSYFHNENELTELKRFISGRNSIFVYKLQYTLTSKMADFILLTWLQFRTNPLLRHYAWWYQSLFKYPKPAAVSFIILFDYRRSDL